MTYDENYTNVIMFWIKIRNRILIQTNKGRDVLILFAISLIRIFNFNMCDKNKGSKIAPMYAIIVFNFE